MDREPSRWRAALPWLLGPVVATALMWSSSWIFLNSASRDSDEPDPVLHEHVAREGTVRRCRREGWAETHYGKHGIAGIADVTAVEGPVVLVWGNSFVAGAQVADKAKVAQQLTKASAALPGLSLTGGGYKIKSDR